MDYPINYDFGKHWQTDIVPHLNSPKLQRSIRKGIQNHAIITKYRYTAPALYCYTDHYGKLMKRKGKLLIEQFRKENKLPIKYLKLEKQMDRAGKLEISSISQSDDKFLKAKKRILRPYLCWNATRNDLESYVLFNGSHSWAPTFELTLAKLVEPNEEWYVRKGKQHSTVINRSHTKVFDLLTWATDRMENYMFGDPLKADVAADSTLGGKLAFMESASD
jgi:hypothetical protein